MLRSLIAVEIEAADVIKKNLEKHPYLKNFKFMVCNDAKDLQDWAKQNIDVLLLSRFLPGEDAMILLEHIKPMFPTTHIILLAGTESEQRRIYLDVAKKNGLTNVVSGKLPGDRPYTIFTAIKEAENEDKQEETLIWEDEENCPDPNSLGGSKSTSTQKIDKLSDVATALKTLLAKENGKHGEVIDQLKSLLEPEQEEEPRDFDPLPPLPPHFTSQVPVNAGGEGVLVIPSANKGGVGKTTVAVTLAMALSEANIPTVILDYDFGAPDIATFFDIHNVPGIEALAGRPVRRGAIEDLLVRKHPNLTVLPGPMDRTIPAFNRGQPMDIVNTLLKMFPVVISDTPPEFWTKPWLSPIFSRADFILAVVDQSKFSQAETKTYAPYMLAMGAKPENIRIVLNRFNPKLHNPKAVENLFCSGFKKSVKTLPKVVAVIPEDWESHVKKGYKGEAAGLDDRYSQWHKLAEEIAHRVGKSYQHKEHQSKKGGLLGRFLGKK